MSTNEKVAGIVNDLIRINNDRIEGYEKAIEDLDAGDADLKTLFQRYISESRQYVTELSNEVERLGGDATESTSVPGKVHRVWIDLKTAITGNDRKSVLESCEFGEDATQKAYETALNADTDLEPTLRDTIVKQKAALRVGHDEVKRLRNLERASS